uniref:Acyl-[acyl-carrier-protein] hydrolase n=1 Tax=Kalanchoe fedtschenkoi TaxID=63787 RepID=A0A7N0U2U6_KALFE
MGSVSCGLTRFGLARIGQDPTTPRGGGGPHNCVRINGNSVASVITSQKPLLAAVTATVPLSSKAVITDDEARAVIAEDVRQNIPTVKQLRDQYRQGVMIEGGVGYRQTVVVRSYEVGPDKTATLESILNLLQETALNHVWMSGLLGNGFGATHGMVKNELIWVVSRMHVQIENYPIWGEVVDIDTFVGASGKNGMRRDWMIRSRATGHVLARATSTWVMMNQKTRRLSKMPDEVRAEISPWFIEKRAIQEHGYEKIPKLDGTAAYAKSNLKPKRSDLDMNHHVNNVKYIKWMLETVPDHILEDSQLCSIILEYRKECGSSDLVQSLCEPQDAGVLVNGFFMDSDVSLSGRHDPIQFTHLLQVRGVSKDEEIVRGQTTWKKRPPSM